MGANVELATPVLAFPRSRRQQDCWCKTVSTFVFSAAMVRTGAALDLRCLGGVVLQYYPPINAVPQLSRYSTPPNV
jgi:hypothetical protein